MTRILFAGFWLCLVTLASGYGAVEYFTRQAGAATDETSYFQGITYERTRAITVPVIADGAVDGYVIAQFVYTAETRKLQALGVPAESFILDEAFHHIFTAQEIDFRNLRRFDSRTFLAELTSRVNTRLEAQIVREMLVEEFNFVDQSQIR
jgi:IMP cyclohydrolase